MTKDTIQMSKFQLSLWSIILTGGVKLKAILLTLGFIFLCHIDISWFKACIDRCCYNVKYLYQYTCTFFNVLKGIGKMCAVFTTEIKEELLKNNYVSIRTKQLTKAFSLPNGRTDVGVDQFCV